MATQGSIDEDALIEYVIEGITDDEVNKAILYGARSLCEFKEKLKLYEKMKEKVSKERRDTRDRKDIEIKRSTHRKQDDNNGIRCFNCGGKGYQSKQCQHKEKGVKSFPCNDFGHIAKDCEKENEQTSTSSRRNEEDKRTCIIQEDDSPLLGHIPLTINGHLFKDSLTQEGI